MYQRDIQTARARVSSGSQIAQTACVPIEYAVVGEGAPVLVVHGAGGGFDQGLDFGLPLTRQGFRVIAMSRFGYLRTPLPDEAAPVAQAEAHACLLARSTGVRRAPRSREGRACRRSLRGSAGGDEMQGNRTRRQAIVGAVGWRVAKRSATARRTQGERGPPEAIIAASAAHFGTGMSQNV